LSENLSPIFVFSYHLFHVAVRIHFFPLSHNTFTSSFKYLDVYQPATLSYHPFRTCAIRSESVKNARWCPNNFAYTLNQKGAQMHVLVGGIFGRAVRLDDADSTMRTHPPPMRGAALSILYSSNFIATLSLAIDHLVAKCSSMLSAILRINVGDHVTGEIVKDGPQARFGRAA